MAKLLRFDLTFGLGKYPAFMEIVPDSLDTLL
jgi:hypothetical protein